ncbi:hypothetical protein BRADI_2g08652v3 [Brachypodium distachyon]|uniref:Uncharacterized protein n=1 Tax=Brachypodium distachyon TaxID=15368 RepID=A0A2K2D7I3_BRADI|nr:hypothetical protein BRADI_2g08652v3 [Brachypodium distachyon]
MRRRSEQGFSPEVRRCGFFPRGNDGYRADLPWLADVQMRSWNFRGRLSAWKSHPGERTGIPAENATTKRVTVRHSGRRGKGRTERGRGHHG